MAKPNPQQILSLARAAMRRVKSSRVGGPELALKDRYEVVIVGANSHGLATAYYLAKVHGITDVAVIDKGRVGEDLRPSSIAAIRSTFLQAATADLHDKARELFQDLNRDLPKPIYERASGALMLAQSEDEAYAWQRVASLNHIRGVPSNYLETEAVKDLVPVLRTDSAFFPVLGALWQEQARPLRYDALIHGLALACLHMGVSIIESCAVTTLTAERGQLTAIETEKGTVTCNKVCVTAAGQASRIAKMVGFRMPVETVSVQSFETDPLKEKIGPMIFANALPAQLRQRSDGALVVGIGPGSYNALHRRGGFLEVETAVRRLIDILPFLADANMTRQWADSRDITADESPILSKTPIEGLFMNCGWRDGGVGASSASGWAMAELIARGRSALADPFSLSRFRSGELVDERAATIAAR